MPDAQTCVDQCMAGLGWSDWENRDGVGRDGTYHALYRWPSGKGRWRMEDVEVVVGVCYALGSTAPAVTRHTEQRDSSPSLFLVSSDSLHSPTTVTLPPPFSFTRSLHAFLSLLSSACRHTLTCCMSPCGNPACHLSIYLKETRFNLLIAERGIYWCIFIRRWLSLNNWVILGTR